MRVAGGTHAGPTGNPYNSQLNGWIYWIIRRNLESRSWMRLDGCQCMRGPKNHIVVCTITQSATPSTKCDTSARVRFEVPLSVEALQLLEEQYD